MADKALDQRAPTSYSGRMFDRIEHTHLGPTARLLALTLACQWDRGEKPNHLDLIATAAGANHARAASHFHDLERDHLVAWHPIEGWVPGPSITHTKPSERALIASFLPDPETAA